MNYVFPLMAVVLLTACAAAEKPVPCPVCYEDEWSREPFPGQAKQHSKTLTPEDLQTNGRDAARSLIGTPSATTPQ